MSFFSGLAGGIADSLNKKKEREERDKIAKLQGQLVEFQIKAGQKQQGAADKIAGMAQPTLGPIETEGTKDIGGRQSPNLQFTGKPGMSLTEILADPEGQIAALQSGMAKMSDLTGKERDFRPPAPVAIADDLGLAGEERKAFLTRDRGEGQVDLLRDMVALQQQRLDLADAQRKFDEGSRRAGTSEALGTFAVETISKNAEEAVEIMQALEGTPLATGTNFAGGARNIQSVIAAGGSALGFDTDDLKDEIAQRDRLDKLFGQILQKRTERMASDGTQITDAKLQQLQRISPDINKRPESNRLLLADYLEEEMAIAAAEGTPIPTDSLKKIGKFILDARAAGVSQSDPIVDVPGAAGAAGASISAIATMTADQLQQLAQSGAELSTEAREAAARRWEELNATR